MTELSKSCVICGDEESNGEPLHAAPCGQHFVCTDDIASFFERATHNESLYPPRCCGQIFMMANYVDHVSHEIYWNFMMKEQGEYAVFPRHRVYCGNPDCGVFLHPKLHMRDHETQIKYAICVNQRCGKATCTGCKTLLDTITQDHVCKKPEDEENFRKLAAENGYQECTACGATVELMEACNHITCECGHNFCYVCGKHWTGLHGCPHYGAATYDEEGYNQDGFHRDTGLNRKGLTRHQEISRRREEGHNREDNEDDESEEDEEDEEHNPDWEVLQHIEPAQRVMINVLRGHDRQDALDQLRIELFETQGIMFGRDPPPPPPPMVQPQNDDENEREADGLQDEDIVLDDTEDEDTEDDESEDNTNDDGEHFVHEGGVQGGRFVDD